LIGLYDEGEVQQQRFDLCRSRFWNDRRKKKFSVVKFNAKELAYAFLRQHDGESLIKAQKVMKIILDFSID
jgi:hypothetical protein